MNLNIFGLEFPLRPKKLKDNVGENGKVKLNPEAVNDEQVVREIVRCIHGEYGKTETIDKINQM